MKINWKFAEIKQPPLDSQSFQDARLTGGKLESGQSGFSLIEVVVAMVIFLIAVLGVFISFTYAVSYNAGNSSRAQALAILQQKVEQMRSAEWTLTKRDPQLEGGIKSPEVKALPDGNRFIVYVAVDDDPSKNDVLIDPDTRFKEISVTVKLDSPTPGWQASVPATIVLRRVRGN